MQNSKRKPYLPSSFLNNATGDNRTKQLYDTNNDGLLVRAEFQSDVTRGLVEDRASVHEDDDEPARFLRQHHV